MVQESIAVDSIDSRTQSAKLVPRKSVLDKSFLAIALLSMSLFGLATRFVGKANNVVDAVMIGGALLVLGAVALRKIDTKEPVTRLLLAAFVSLLLGLLISFAQTRSVRAILQVLLYSAYLLPLVWIPRIPPRDAYRFFLPLLICISLVQLPIDILFPRYGTVVQDMYYGTFTSPNMKGRFLILTMMIIGLAYRRGIVFNRIILPIILAAIGYSFYLGSAKSAYVFFLLALISSLFRNRLLLLGTLACGVVALAAYLIQAYSTEPIIYMNSSRFLDEEYGTYAVIKYGFELLRQSWYFGVGYGEFISRTAQTMGGHYVASVPRTMISYGTIYDNVVAPLGVPALVSILTEGGLLGGGLFYVLYTLGLYKLRHPSAFGFALFAYISFMAILMPMYFEVAEGAVLTYTYALGSRALFHCWPAEAS